MNRFLVPQEELWAIFCMKWREMEAGQAALLKITSCCNTPNSGSKSENFQNKRNSCLFRQTRCKRLLGFTKNTLHRRIEMRISWPRLWNFFGIRTLTPFFFHRDKPFVALFAPLLLSTNDIFDWAGAIFKRWCVSIMVREKAREQCLGRQYTLFKANMTGLNSKLRTGQIAGYKCRQTTIWVRNGGV